MKVTAREEWQPETFFFPFHQLGADCCLSSMLTVFIGLAWSLCFTQTSGSQIWECSGSAVFLQGRRSHVADFLSQCLQKLDFQWNFLYRSLSLGSFCGCIWETVPEVSVCVFISFLLFPLAKLQADIKLQERKKLLIFHGVMYYSARNDDAKLAIRGQTSADSKCFLLRKSSLFLGTSFVLLC